MATSKAKKEKFDTTAFVFETSIADIEAAMARLFEQSFVGPPVVEEWRPIKEVAFYEISSLGRVRSLPHGKSKGGLLKPTLSNHGYYMVDLRGAGRRVELVSRLVAEVFLEEPSEDLIKECLKIGSVPFINHKNRIRTDNRPTNLEWCTPSYNNAVENIKHHRPTNVLSGDDVIEIMAYHMVGYSYTDLSKMFNVAVSTISNIFNGYTWNHLTGLPKRTRKDRPSKTKKLNEGRINEH